MVSSLHDFCDAGLCCMEQIIRLLFRDGWLVGWFVGWLVDCWLDSCVRRVFGLISFDFQ